MQKISLDTPESRSADLMAENIGRLKQLFPEAFTEDKIDFQVLKQLLGGAVEERPEKYGLNWHGKRRARQIALTPSLGTLRPSPEESLHWETTRNLMIEGDNLEVLKLLQKSYAGKVKLIYIDPPYNTGKDFVYPDDFKESVRNYLEITGQADGGKPLNSNPESSGRFHTTWLNMMYPRLKLARDLLKDDGIICISMDDHELSTLRLICDEIFGEESFVGTLTWTTTTQPDNIGRARFGLQQNIEYVLMYSKCTRINLPPFVLEPSGNAPRYPHKGRFGPCRFEIIERAFEGAYARPTMRFKILGQEPREGKQWQIGEKQARELESQGKVEIVEGMIKRAVYPEDEAGDADSFLPFWAHLKKVQTSQKGKAEVTELLGSGHGMDTVKPTSLILDILKHLPKDALVMDFFAGSGTTGHAVFQANAHDGGSRRFILAQLPFQLDPEDSRQRSSAEFCDTLGVPRSFSELTKERIRRAGRRLQSEVANDSDLGFRVFKLDSSNIRAWNPDTSDLEGHLLEHQKHVLPGRTDTDLLFETMLRLGIDLAAPVKSISVGGKEVRSIEEGRLFACLVPSISREEAVPLADGIAKWRKQLMPEFESRVVFLDSAFVDDVAKTNLEGLLRQYGFQKNHILSL